MRLVLLGPPGAGKGTQAVKLAEEKSCVHISTGDLFREALRKGTPLGVEAKGYMDRGELVPDKVVVNMILERLKEDDVKNGFCLDGFPRTIEQADVLEKLLEEIDETLDYVIYINVPRDVLVKRLTGRRVCSDCGAGYHLISSPSEKEGICNECGGALVQRDDDKEETVVHRLDIYEENTEPLVEYYRKQGILLVADGAQDIESVNKEVLNLLDKEERAN